MNKEEMLQSLKDLKFNINGGLVDNETKEKLENLEIDLNLLDDEIFELSNKIQDDTNYPTFFALYDEAEVSNAKRELNIAKAGLESTKLTIAQVEEYIAYIKREIEENNKKMAELNRENLEQGARLRELGITPNPEEENLIRETLNVNRNEISKLNIKNDRAKQILVENENQLTGLLNNKSDFENKMNNAQINLNNAESLQASRPLVNEAKRNIDKEELNDLKYIKSTMENEKSALSINLADEVEKIINDLQADVITVNDVNNRLEDLKKNMPAGYFNADVEDRNNELVQNRKVQVELEDKINNLTAKVNNVDNYRYSDAELAREEEKVKILAVKVQNSNLKIVEFEKAKQQLESDLIEQNKKVESREVENRIIGLKAQLRRAKTNEQREQINKEIEASQKEAWNDLNELTDKKAELELVNSSLVAEESNLERYVKLHENAVNRKEDIDRRLKNNEVQNSYQKRLDEMELAKSKASLEALKNRAQFISLPVLEQVNNLINNNVKVEENKEPVFKGKNGEEIKVGAPLPFDNDLGVKDSSFDEKTNQIFMDEPKSNSLEENILNTLNNDPKLGGLKFSFPEQNEEEKENEEINPIFNPEINLDEQQLNNEEQELNVENKEEVVEEEKEETKVVPVVGKMKAKFKEASDKLKNKAKDLNFRAKLKKWAKVIAVVAASAVLLVASGKLPQKTLEDLQDPQVIEQIDNEELDPNEIIEEDVKEEENKEDVVEENNNNNVVEDKKENENKNQVGGNPNPSNNNNNNSNNNSNNNNNNNNGSNPVDDHDNSDEITVPEENNNNNNQDDITIDEDTPVEEIVDDAVIEDDNNDAVIEDDNNDAVIEDDENNDAVIDDENNDAVIDDENEEVFDNEDQFDNEDEFENGENNDGVIEDDQENVFDNEDQFDNEDEFENGENNDGVIEDDQENVFDNEDQFDNNENENNNDQNTEQEDVYDNEEQFDNNQNDNSTNDEPVVEEDVYDNEDQFDNSQNDSSTNDEPVVEEDVYDNLEDTNNNVEDNTQEEVYDNVEDNNVQDNNQTTDQIEVLPGETYLNDQQEEVYTNGGNVDDAIEKEPNIESIEQGEDKDILNVYTNEEQISYNSEIEQLKQLREYYANNTIEEENSMTRSL